MNKNKDKLDQKIDISKDNDVNKIYNIDKKYEE